MGRSGSAWLNSQDFINMHMVLCMLWEVLILNARCKRAQLPFGPDCCKGMVMPTQVARETPVICEQPREGGVHVPVLFTLPRREVFYKNK